MVDLKTLKIRPFLEHPKHLRDLRPVNLFLQFFENLSILHQKIFGPQIDALCDAEQLYELILGWHFGLKSKDSSEIEIQYKN